MARARGIELAHVVTAAEVRLEWSEGAGDHRLVASDLSVRLTSPAGARELQALVDAASEHCPVCQAIRGNVAMRVTASFDAP
jgi:organic hydroperoxide reductase OsmC/OhrA